MCKDKTIDDYMRKKLQETPGVDEVTKRHIILENGEVLDPGEFPFEILQTRFILKLQKCGCSPEQHRAGLHALVEGEVLTFADNHLAVAYDTPAICNDGAWELHEARVAPGWISGPFAEHVERMPREQRPTVRGLVVTGDSPGDSPRNSETGE